MDADFCPDPTHLESTKWRAREAKQLDEIERLFELLVRRCEDIHDERKGQPGHRCDKWTLKEQLKPPDVERLQAFRWRLGAKNGREGLEY